jgi:uncharacterized membrane protein YraQ (UPF0718 family)
VLEVVTATLSQDEQAAQEAAARAAGGTTSGPEAQTVGGTPAPRRQLLDARLVVLLLLVALGSRGLLGGALDHLALRTWATIFMAVTVQALPFLALGVLVSGAIAALVSPAALARLLPRRPLIAVPVAAVAGTALPGCECASVPIAGRLTTRGVPPAAALAFMLAAPAVNPVVLVATAVAFPGQPRMVLARFLGSLLTSIVVGLLWSRSRHDALVERARGRLVSEGPRWQAFTSAARRDLYEAGGWLVVGAAAAATLQVVVPRSALLAVAHQPMLAAPALGVLAVLLAICSEADAFVAASLREFSLTARLVFLVVGPAVDVKLIAMQSGVFGRRFAARFAPLTFVVAVTCALLVGKALL